MMKKKKSIKVAAFHNSLLSNIQVCYLQNLAIIPPPAHSMTFYPSSIADLFPCHKINISFMPGGLGHIRVKKSQDIVSLLIFIQLPESFSASHDVAFGEASFAILETFSTTAMFTMGFFYGFARQLFKTSLFSYLLKCQVCLLSGNMQVQHILTELYTPLPFSCECLLLLFWNKFWITANQLFNGLNDVSFWWVTLK